MRVTAHIDLAALSHNLGVVKQHAPQTQVMAMIKANAYGHGLVLCAKALSGAAYFGIATLEEARQLRQAGINQAIVLMPGFQNSQDLKDLRELNLDTVVYDARQLDLLRQHRAEQKLRVWLKIDTGMHRLGCTVREASAFLRQLEALPQVEVVAVMSHLACADINNDPHTLRQLEVFEQLTASWSYPRSMLNSAGILHYPQSKYEIVRPGLMLFGASPVHSLTAKELGLKAVMELSVKVFELLRVTKGEGVGYGQDWLAKRDSLIATLAIGYGDGYPQYAHDAMALIRGQPCPIVGRVSMDYLAIDVTDIAGAAVGDTVILWGADLPVNTVAHHARESVYRLLTGVMERVERIAK